MRRVLIIGPGGSGKSTFARALAERTKLPLIHLDSLYWSPGWKATPNEQWDRVIEELCRRETWVMDGNYSRTLGPRLAACDTVFFLDIPRSICLLRIFRRRVTYRGRSRPDLAEGCPENLTWEFIRWVWTYRKKRRPQILQRLATLPASKHVIILRSVRDVQGYLRAGLR